MSNFINAVKQTMNDPLNESVTENGALGYRTTGKELLDLNFAVTSLRCVSPANIAARFTRAFFEDKLAALKWLFYARDIRGGLGERRLFRVILENMARKRPEYILPLLHLVPEYGRYDDLWCLLDTGVSSHVLKLASDQFMRDLAALQEGQQISLLAKWLPSINASSSTTKRYARMLCSHMGVSQSFYRKALSRLRTRLDVVEKKMSTKAWGDIRYEAVPSRANLVYNKSFLRNDYDRRNAFLLSLEKGNVKINAGTLYPHDIVSRYQRQPGNREDATLEGLWKALPDTVQGHGNTIVVADGSGSMLSGVSPDSAVTALDVANALAIYFAERSSGQFRDTYITFSEKPQLVDLSVGKSLREKLQIANLFDEAANTNIQAVFELILKTAISHRMTQDELPQNILIISDMEFDICADFVFNGKTFRYGYHELPNVHLFQEIAEDYANAGYQLPRLVFWNVCSRTGTIPVTENDLGVALVSGFSPYIANMVMSGKTDPYECLLDTLNSTRYQPVEDALRLFSFI